MQKTPSAIRLYQGLSIYRVANSPNWYVRIWDRKRKKYKVKSTGQTSAIQAKAMAQELGIALLKAEPEVEKEYSFKTYADKLLKKATLQADTGERNRTYIKTMHWCILTPEWGLFDYFGEMDIRTIKTSTFSEYKAWLNKKRSDLSPSTLNTLTATFRNVMKIALEDNVINSVPNTPRTKQKDNPRPFYRFHPLVAKEDDAYQKLLTTAKKLAGEKVVVRGNLITEELYDLLLFLAHSFVRPLTTELYAIRHSDITRAEDPRRLIVTVKNGKTGYRAANTMEAAVSVYDRICDRNPNRSPDDFIFLPEHKNRTTASRIFQRQFQELSKRADLQIDANTGQPFSLYSLRHTAICMRIVNSKGKVNIYSLAKNAGTSVDQIERFYARFLPLSNELARNLQSFGD